MSENDTGLTCGETGATNSCQFSFRKMSGMEQAMLLTDEEWFNLEKLDPKIWMALSCPTAGLEFDKETLCLLDKNGDGRIHANDVLEEVSWICERIYHPSDFTQSGNHLRLENIRTDTDAGKELLAAANFVLSRACHVNCADCDEINPEQIEASLKEASSYPFNGDGILPLYSVENFTCFDEHISQKKILASRVLRQGIAIVGAKEDASGKPGLDTQLFEEARAKLLEVLTWRKDLKKASMPLGEQSSDAWDLLAELSPKIDDYFYRCKALAFAPYLKEYLNSVAVTGRESMTNEPALNLLDPAVAKTLPLARIENDNSLPLLENVNPAFSTQLEKFHKYFAKYLVQDGKNLSESEWREIKKLFEPYAAILERKPAFPDAEAGAEHMNFPGIPDLVLAESGDSFGRHWLPASANAFIETLADEDIEAFLDESSSDAFALFVKMDLEAPRISALQNLKKMILYRANIYEFLMNFVSFANFYAIDKKAIFQTGTLYLDGRACFLCVPVQDVDAHVRLAEQSHLCLVYCECSRKSADGAENRRIIAAAITAGLMVSLIEGRHGVFVDNEGEQWDTTILRIVHNPISIKEAVWAPYFRAANMLGEQFHKFVAMKDNEAQKKISDGKTSLIPPIKTGSSSQEEASPKQGFDFAKGAGMFAAISVGLSVVSAALAYIAKSVASVGWWWPVLVCVVFICISGPSVILAWLKLRKRSLGPLLDASNWAVNKGTPINLVMGNALTAIGKIPANAQHDLNDPYALTTRIRRKKHLLKSILLIFIVCCILTAFVGAYLWYMGIPDWLARFLPESLKPLTVMGPPSPF